MKVKQIFMNDSAGLWSSSAQIDVPGLGVVEIKNFVSDDARARVEAEAVMALQQRLGIVCNFRDGVIK